ncbi:MAG: sodium:proline symporter, partial [Gammaproteobacteria bacterium]|nr:sodium:proline symporter [Gammaproteobacteria bacterium]
VTAVVIGSAGAGLVGAGDDPERVFMLAVADRFPPWLAGFCLAAILAAVMSTADSQLLVTAAALAEDLLPRAGQGSAARRLRNGRIAVAVVAVAACALALDPESGVFALVARAWAGFGATLGPVLLIALYARRASGRGAVAGLLGGAVVVSAWPLLPGDGFGVYELLPGFVAALALNLGVNRLQARAEDGPA